HGRQFRITIASMEMAVPGEIAEHPEVAWRVARRGSGAVCGGLEQHDAVVRTGVVRDIERSPLRNERLQAAARLGTRSVEILSAQYPQLRRPVCPQGRHRVVVEWRMPVELRPHPAQLRPRMRQHQEYEVAVQVLVPWRAPVPRSHG